MFIYFGSVHASRKKLHLVINGWLLVAMISKCWINKTNIRCFANAIKLWCTMKEKLLPVLVKSNKETMKKEEKSNLGD